MVVAVQELSVRCDQSVPVLAVPVQLVHCGQPLQVAAVLVQLGRLMQLARLHS